MTKALSGSSIGLDYIIPPSVCVMVNVIDYADEQVGVVVVGTVVVVHKHFQASIFICHFKS